MVTALDEDLAAYKADAAKRWLTRHSKSSPHVSTQWTVSISQEADRPIDLRENASEAHPEVCEALAAHVARQRLRWLEANRVKSLLAQSLSKAAPLGRGPPRGGIFDIRASAWLLLKLCPALPTSRVPSVLTSEIAYSGLCIVTEASDAMTPIRTCSSELPADVRANAHARWKQFKAAQLSSSAGWNAMRSRQYSHLSPCGECHLFRASIATPLLPYVQRARQQFLCGNPAFKCTRSEDVPSDVALAPSIDSSRSPKREYQEDGLSAWEVQSMSPACYAGKPDELYRRTQSKRYARWRSAEQTRLQAEKQALESAEREMKRRRGHDLSLSSRIVGDTDFAPFMYDNRNNCFAFSSKISEKSQLRDSMLQKYASQAEADDRLKGLEHAKHVAESKEMFHTKVMNRFS